MLVIRNHIAIADSEIEFSAIRAQGAGGQNVNKVASAVHLRFDIKASSLPAACQRALLTYQDQRISSDGVIVIKAQRFRTQDQNRQDARARLKALILAATHRCKARKATRPSKNSQKNVWTVKPGGGRQKLCAAGSVSNESTYVVSGEMSFMQALFARDGDYYIPSETAGSPWGPGSLHGGAPTALMVSAMQSRYTSDDMQLVRFTVDLFRSVPMAPLRMACKTVRDGKRVKVFDVSLFHDDMEVCRASGLVLQKSTIEVPDYARTDVSLPEHIKAALAGETVVGIRPEHRLYAGPGTPGLHNTVPLKPVFLKIGVGQGCSWVRLPVEVIAGRRNTALDTVAALADFANGFSQVHLNEQVGFINADLVVNLFRMPESAWLCIDARAFPQANGLAMVETVLYDEAGMIGRVAQSNLTMQRYTTPPT